MESLPAIPMFFFVGLYPFKYSKTFKLFRICLFRAIYCAFVMLFVTGYDLYRALLNVSNLKSLIYDEQEKSVNRMGEIIRKIDYLAWIVIHSFSTIFVFFRMKGFCKLLNSLNNVVQKLVTSRIVSETNVVNKKICRIISATLFSISICIYFGLRWSYSISIKTYISYWILGLHFPMVQIYEIVFFEKARFYLASLQHSFHPKNHQKLHFWVTVQQELWKISRLNCKLFAHIKVVSLMGTIVLISAFWFYNYDRFMSICASFAWQLTHIPIFFLCWKWNELDKEVSHFF